MGSTSVPSLAHASVAVDPDFITDPNDPANNINLPVPGWPLLANIMDDVRELEAFASFRDLNIKSLLYYQAELIYLRKRLHRVEWDDHRASRQQKRSHYADNLELMIREREHSIESASSKNPLPLPEQWIVIERIRATLDKYNSALLQYSETAKLPVPDASNVAVLRKCVSLAGEDRAAFRGDSAYTWGDYNKSPEKKSLIELFWGLFARIVIYPANRPEGSTFFFKEHLVTIRSPEPGNALRNWAMLRFVPFYDELQISYPFPCHNTKYLLPLRPIWIALIIVSLILQSLWRFLLVLWRVITPLSLLKRKGVGDLEKGNFDATTSHSYYTEMNQKSTIVMFLGTLAVRFVIFVLKIVVISLLPIVAITVLAKAHGINLILGLIAAFTATFAAGIVFLSPTSSALDILGTTATFSAVMVVFAQAQIGAH